MFWEDGKMSCQRIVTNLVPFLFDLRINFALRRGWKIESITAHSGFMGRVVLVAILFSTKS